MRRIISLTILCSLTLHGASRVGILSYLHEHRHDIAYSIGVIAEIPIALCNSDYDFNKGLTIDLSHDDELPKSLMQAPEILLFLQYAVILILPPQYMINEVPSSSYKEKNYTAAVFSIFHPPSLA